MQDGRLRNSGIDCGASVMADNPLSVFENQLESFSVAEQNLFENRYKYWKEQNSTGILFNSNGVYKQLAHYNADNPRYNGRGNYVVNLGYSTEERNGIYIYISIRQEHILLII